MRGIGGEAGDNPPHSPGGVQPQDQKKKEVAYGPTTNSKSGKKGPLALGSASAKTEGNANRRGKLTKRNSDAGVGEVMQGTDDADDEY